MESLKPAKGLFISQKKEWGEILSGFEFKNRYVVYDAPGHELYWALEEPGSTMARIFLKALRPFEIQILTLEQRPVIRVSRPFKFYFHEATVIDAQGETLGSIQRRFSLLRRIYTVYDGSGKEIFKLFGPILHPWTFEIRRNDKIFGKITKKWSGLVQEGISDADNFGVEFPVDWPVECKALFLGAVFLIDFVHFENKGKR